MTWSSVNLKIGLKFINLASDSYDNRKIKMPYVLALESIHELANVAVNQYKQFESRGIQIQLKDVSAKVITTMPAPTTKEVVLSFREVNRLLKILLNLEE
jgi:hypothetical protein